MEYEPCRVCEAVSEGFRFGAYACQACAVFFRRTVVEDIQLACKNGSTCVISKKSRLRCRACRLKKCYDVGMKRENVLDNKNFKNIDPAAGIVPDPSSTTTLATISKLGSAYSSFCQSQKTLFKLNFMSPVEQLRGDDFEFIPTTTEMHNLMEKSNVGLIANFLMDNFDLFTNLSREEKIACFVPTSVRFNHLHQCFLSTRFVDETDDVDQFKIGLHHGLYCDLKGLKDLFSFVSICPEVETFTKPVIEIYKNLSTKVKRSELDLVDVGAVIGLIFYSQLEKCRISVKEAEQGKNEILKELHQKLVRKLGSDQGGVAFGNIVVLLLEVEQLTASKMNARIMRKVFIQDLAADLFMISEDSNESEI